MANPVKPNPYAEKRKKNSALSDAIDHVWAVASAPAAEVPSPTSVAFSEGPVADEEEHWSPQPEVEKIRLKARPSSDGRVRSKTIAPKRLTRDERRLSQLLVYPEDVERPHIREECLRAPRPCPFVACAHHLYMDINPESGAIKLNFPHLEVWEMSESCALDVADRGGITLEEVGAILNLTRERIRQVEVRGLCKIRKDGGEALGEHGEEVSSSGSGSVRRTNR